MGLWLYIFIPFYIHNSHLEGEINQPSSSKGADIVIDAQVDLL